MAHSSANLHPSGQHSETNSNLCRQVALDMGLQRDVGNREWVADLMQLLDVPPPSPPPGPHSPRNTTLRLLGCAQTFDLQETISAQRRLPIQIVGPVFAALVLSRWTGSVCLWFCQARIWQAKNCSSLGTTIVVDEDKPSLDGCIIICIQHRHCRWLETTCVARSADDLDKS